MSVRLLLLVVSKPCGEQAEIFLHGHSLNYSLTGAVITFLGGKLGMKTKCVI